MVFPLTAAVSILASVASLQQGSASDGPPAYEQSDCRIPTFHEATGPSRYSSSLPNGHTRVRGDRGIVSEQIAYSQSQKKIRFWITFSQENEQALLRLLEPSEKYDFYDDLMDKVWQLPVFQQPTEGRIYLLLSGLLEATKKTDRNSGENVNRQKTVNILREKLLEFVGESTVDTLLALKYLEHDQYKEKMADFLWDPVVAKKQDAARDILIKWITMAKAREALQQAATDKDVDLMEKLLESRWTDIDRGTAKRTIALLDTSIANGQPVDVREAAVRCKLELKQSMFRCVILGGWRG